MELVSPTAMTLGQVLDQDGTVVTTNADAQGGMSGGAALVQTRS